MGSSASVHSSPDTIDDKLALLSTRPDVPLFSYLLSGRTRHELPQVGIILPHSGYLVKTGLRWTHTLTPFVHDIDVSHTVREVVSCLLRMKNADTELHEEAQNASRIAVNILGQLAILDDHKCITLRLPIRLHNYLKYTPFSSFKSVTTSSCVEYTVTPSDAYTAVIELCALVSATGLLSLQEVQKHNRLAEVVIVLYHIITACVLHNQDYYNFRDDSIQTILFVIDHISPDMSYTLTGCKTTENDSPSRDAQIDLDESSLETQLQIYLPCDKTLSGREWIARFITSVKDHDSTYNITFHSMVRRLINNLRVTDV